MTRHAYTVINAARDLTQRHPGISPSVAQVAAALATYADPQTGGRIFPGNDNLVRITSLHKSTVRAAIKELLALGEIHLDKPGRRGSAACYTWLGGMGRAEPEAEPAAAPEPDDGPLSDGFRQYLKQVAVKDLEHMRTEDFRSAAERRAITAELRGLRPADQREESSE